MAKDKYRPLVNKYEKVLLEKNKKLYQDLLKKTQQDLLNLYNTNDYYGRTEYYQSAKYIELIKSLNNRLQELGIAQDKQLTEELVKFAKEIQNKVGLDIGIPGNANLFSTEPIVKTIWAPDKKDFSARIWTNNNLVKEALTEGIADVIIRGKGEEAIISELLPLVKTTCSTGLSRATTLARTELAFVRANQTLESYRKAGIKEYIFKNTDDKDTCDICHDYNDKHFLVKDAVIGENFPPMHPNCRGWTIPVFK